LVYTFGEEQGTKADPSRAHSKADASFAANPKLGDVTLLGLLGFAVIVTWGAVPSTTTVGWEPESANDGEVGSSINSSAAQVYVPGGVADVARKATVSVPPAHSLVVFPPGHLRLIF
jgi:hypothetical protein